jgi:hypothetical protein
MEDVVSFAANPTNSVGKSFKRETIVVNSRYKAKSLACLARLSPEA